MERETFLGVAQRAPRSEEGVGQGVGIKELDRSRQ
jgi:hypothetical protein